MTFLQKSGSSSTTGVKDWATFKEKFSNSPYKEKLETEQAAFEWVYSRSSASAKISHPKEETVEKDHSKVYEKTRLLLCIVADADPKEADIQYDASKTTGPELIAHNFKALKETGVEQDRRIVLLKGDVTCVSQKQLFDAVQLATRNTEKSSTASIAGGVIDMPYAYGQLTAYMQARAANSAKDPEHGGNPNDAWCENKFEIEQFRQMWENMERAFTMDVMSKTKWIIFGGLQQVRLSILLMSRDICLADWRCGVLPRTAGLQRGVLDLAKGEDSAWKPDLFIVKHDRAHSCCDGQRRGEGLARLQSGLR
jgi:hypothetical protein